LRKTPNFFAENWQKSEKIVIITLTADWANFRQLGDCFLKAISITLTLLRFLTITEEHSIHNWATFFHI
jgi:hypothetical protein